MSLYWWRNKFSKSCTIISFPPPCAAFYKNNTIHIGGLLLPSNRPQGMLHVKCVSICLLIFLVYSSLGTDWTNQTCGSDIAWGGMNSRIPLGRALSVWQNRKVVRFSQAAFFVFVGVSQLCSQMDFSNYISTSQGIKLKFTCESRY